MALQVKKAEPFGDLLVNAAPQQKLSVGPAGPQQSLSVGPAQQNMRITGVSGAAPNRNVVPQRINPMQNPLAWFGDQAKQFATGVANATPLGMFTVGQDWANSIDQVTSWNRKDSKNAREAQSRLEQQNIDLMKRAAQKIQDPNTSDAERARWQNFVRSQAHLAGTNQFQDATIANDATIEATDPLQGAINTVTLALGGLDAKPVAGAAGDIYAAIAKSGVKKDALDYLVRRATVGRTDIPVTKMGGGDVPIPVRVNTKIPVRSEPGNDVLDARLSREVEVVSARHEQELLAAEKGPNPLLDTEAVNTKYNAIYDDLLTKRDSGTLPQRIEVKDGNAPKSGRKAQQLGDPSQIKTPAQIKADKTKQAFDDAYNEVGVIKPKVSLKVKATGDSSAIKVQKGQQTKPGDAYTILKQESDEARNRYKGSFFGNTWSDFKRVLIDPYAAFAKSDRKAAKFRGTTENKMRSGQKLTKLAGDIHNAEGILDEQIRKITLKDGRTLKKVMEKYPNGDRMQNFLIYAANKSDLENRGIKGGKKLNPQLSDEQVRKAVDDFERANPGADADAQVLKFFKDVMEVEGVRSGSLKMKDAAAAIRSRRYYYPTKRVDTGKSKPQVSGTLKGSTADQQIIKSREGGGDPVDYSWEAVTDRFLGDTKQNLQSRFYRELARRADEGTVNARRVTLKDGEAGPLGFEPGSPFGRELYRGLEDGDQTALEIDRELSKTFQGLSSSQAKNFITALNNIPVNVMKAVFTGILNPVFHAINLVKNPLLLIHNKGIGAVGIRPIISGVGGVVNRGKFSERGLKAYGANTVKATQSAATPKVRAEMLALDTKNAAAVAKFTLNHPWTSIKAVGRAIDHVLAFSDRTFRSMAARQAYIQAKRGGEHEVFAMERAAEAYNESLGNFNRVTEAARGAEPLLLYAGATQAGARAFGKAYIDHPIQTLLFDAAFVGGIGTMFAANQKSEAGKKFYEDMINSKKAYILDDNFIVVLPTAYKDDKTGAWHGVMKVPLAPDFRPLNRAVWKTMMGKSPTPEDLLGHFSGDIVKSIREIPQNNPVVNAASVAMNRDPRTGEEIVSKFERATKPVSEQLDPDYTSKAASKISGIVGVSPKQIDAFLNNLGLTGDIIQNKAGNPLSTVKQSFLNQFGANLKGQSSGAKFYQDITEVTKSLKNEADFTAFALIHTKNDDKTIDSPAARAKILLAQPEVLKAENKLNQLSAKRGELSNPFYDLAPDQQQKVLRYRASKDLNAAKQSYSKDGKPLFTELGLDEEWYQTFRDKENGFYDKIASKSGGSTGDSERAISTYSGAKSPSDPAMDSLQDQYNALPKGTGERTAYLNAHPELLKYWADKDGFTDAERLAIGLKPMSSDSASSSYGKYANNGSGSGGSGVNPYSKTLSRGSRSNLRGSAKASASSGRASVKFAGATSGGSIAKPKVSIKKIKV